MKKILIALLSIGIAFTAVSPSQAEDQKILAIIDTAINSGNHPSVIQEACFTSIVSKDFVGCPNGTTFMEGKSSASAVWPTSINNNTYHGDSMVKAALAVNPNVKIVFVRVADVNNLGNNIIQPQPLISAIKWVSDNSEKYSIDAVSISLSGMGSLSSLCSNELTINSVSFLTSKNIPTFAATGNNSSKTLVGFPACVPGVIGVGSLTDQVNAGTKVGETATNRGPGLDVLALGKITITKYNGSLTDLSGSSGANVISASTYVGKNTYSTVVQYLDSLSKEPVKFVDYFITNADKSKTIVWEPSRLISISYK